MAKLRLPPRAAIGFLLPNFFGLAAFVLLPVVLSLWMAFTNWSLKPAVRFEFVGLRNFQDLMAARAIAGGDALAVWLYVLSVAAVVAGVVGALWANFAGWRGLRATGAILSATGLATAIAGVQGGSVGTVLAGLVLLACGLAAMLKEDATWRGLRGAVPGLLVLFGVLGLGLLSGRMWQAYEPRDARFWQYFYNTAFLMSGIPFGILGSLGLALLLDEALPVGGAGRRGMVAGLILVLGGAVSLWMYLIGWRDAAVLTALLWVLAALGLAFNVVTFRTLFYLPTFTAGVALMILWKALYNPQIGPINAVLQGLFGLLGIGAKPPEWLGNESWAKPSLIIMGLWVGVGGTNMLLYLAALSSVPKDLIDAAQVDGAGPWARFRHVTWPQLAPTTFFISVMSIIGGLQGGFEQARVMTNGGPAGATTTLSFYIYNKAFQDLDLGYAAAISWVLFAIIFVTTALNWKFGKGMELDL